MRKNPYEKDGKWFFYDETGDEHGPYDSMHLANANMYLHAHWLDTNEQYEVVRREGR